MPGSKVHAMEGELKLHQLQLQLQRQLQRQTVAVRVNFLELPKQIYLLSKLLHLCVSQGTSLRIAFQLMHNSPMSWLGSRFVAAFICSRVCGRRGPGVDFT